MQTESDQVVQSTMETLCNSSIRTLGPEIIFGTLFDLIGFDMTTLYFESEEEDDLRKVGFSKDGKFQKPKIMLGLLVGESGFPIGYDLFEGHTFEGHTLLPTLTKSQQRYGFIYYQCRRAISRTLLLT